MIFTTLCCRAAVEPFSTPVGARQRLFRSHGIISPPLSLPTESDTPGSLTLSRYTDEVSTRILEAPASNRTMSTGNTTTKKNTPTSTDGRGIRREE